MRRWGSFLCNASITGQPLSRNDQVQACMPSWCWSPPMHNDERSYSGVITGTLDQPLRSKVTMDACWRMSSR